MTQLADKVVSMTEAVALVLDGMRVAIGGFGNYQRPMAFVRELIRCGRKGLTIVGTVNAIEVDMLVGAGAVNRIETSYVGLEKYGLARNFRRACEAGQIAVVDYPEVLSFDRFRASRENFSFWPCEYLGGTDIVTYNSDIKPFDCPLTGKKLYAVPPASPDVVVLHAIAADRSGNILWPSRRLLPQELDLDLAGSCDTVIVTVEKVVSREFVRRNAALNFIPSYRTTAIVEAPWGSHPTPTLSRWLIDSQHFVEYVAASSTVQSFSSYLDQWVFNLQNHGEYLDKLGGDHLSKLTELDVL